MQPTPTDTATIAVLGADSTNIESLRSMPGHEEHTFVPLLTAEEMQEGEVSIPDLLDRAVAELERRERPVDAVIGFWDFPVSTLVPLVAARFGLPSSSLRSVVTCEHKYWSRLEQARAVPDLPRFGLVDLADETPHLPAGMRYPVWLKPVKSYSSELAFHVADDAQFADAVEQIRQGIGRLGRPFEQVLDMLDLPPEIAEVGGQACLAEEALTGRRAATEGYVHDGRVVVYGVLDSIDYPDSSVFLRHQYPSQLPEHLQRRLVDVSERVIAQVGLDWTTFSVEFFCDPDSGDVSVLEINPRHSQSHALLFDAVDGVANHHAMVSLALGRDPAMPCGKGRYGIAAKWYHRRFTDGLVTRIPTDDEIARIERDLPGVRLTPVPVEGQRLSDLPAQDSYSYELTDVVVGARDEAELVRTYERAVAELDYRFDEGQG